MVLSCAIDAKKSRYVVIKDSPGAFLHADMEDGVHAPGRNNFRVNCQTGNKTLQKAHLVQSERKADALHTTQESTIQYAAGCSIVLEAIIQHITEVALQNQQI